jgi:hypothetical protein
MKASNFPKPLQFLLLVGALVVAQAVTGQATSAGLPLGQGTVYNGNPSNYLSLLSILQPGDTLLLEAGTYSGGLPIDNMLGTLANPIVIAGPESGPRAVFPARSCCNTVSIRDSAYVAIYNLELDGQGLPNVDAVKAEGDAQWAHHITLENLTIHDHDANQQTVGISTKCPAWDWVIRNNVVDSAGTGLYLGNSDGSAPFVNGLIEGNLVVDTIGYNLQIKHQNERPAGIGLPASGKTIIRHNVFSKANNASTGGNARPNLLVGHWPLSGAGADDVYEIYGNFFYQNPSGEPLFQGEGNVALYDNLFVNNNGDAVWIQPHNDLPKQIRVFNNTVVASGTGIRVSGGDPGFQQKVIGNAVFAATPISASDQQDNVTDTQANASNYLVNPGGSPTGSPSQLDLYPRPGTLSGTLLDSSSYQTFDDWDRDFNGDQHDGTFRGAYAGQGTNPGWLPQLARKPLGNIQIGGTVKEGGNGLVGVTFSASGASCNSSDSNGVYSCLVTSGWSGIVTPSKIGYAFAPAWRTYTGIMTDTLGQDYAATYTLIYDQHIPLVLKE